MMNLFLVLNGDSFLDIDLRVLKNFHVSNNLDLTITIKRMNNCKRYGQIILNNKKISKFFISREQCTRIYLIPEFTLQIDKFSIVLH